MTIFHSYYFPLPLRIFGASLPFFALMSVVKFNNWIAAFFMIVFTVVFMTTRYILNINTDKKTLSEYLWVLGYKKGKKNKYLKIHGLTITENQTKRTYNSRGSTTTVKTDVYKLWLNVDDINVEAFQTENRERVLSKARSIANKLSLHITDNSI